jgi:hypothetical protein
MVQSAARYSPNLKPTQLLMRLTDPRRGGFMIYENDTSDQGSRTPILLYSLDGRFVKLDRIGEVPEGERINAHYMGEANGIIGKGTIRGIDYSLTGSDGVVQIHVHEVFYSPEKELVAFEREGHGRPVGDGELCLKGTAKARTAIPALKWINYAALWWMGTVYKKTGRLELSIYTDDEPARLVKGGEYVG